MEYRREKDFLGEMEIPGEAYYGIHTLRAAQNFGDSGIKAHPDLIKALAQVKEACALANMQCGLLDQRVGQAVAQAAREVVRGELAGEFMVDAWQGGAGTSTNMNMNEVLANRAIELLGGQKGDYRLVHPLDQVNQSQSTNDVYPTALRIAAIGRVLELSQNMARLQGALQEKEAQFSGILKLGRTEMQDAVPVTLGQEFSAYAEAIARDRWRLYKVEERLRQVNLGGTAVGTGLNAHPQYIYTVIEELRSITGFGLARGENTVDLTQNADVFVEVSGLLKAAAVNLIKIAGDLILLSSGPFGGLGEIALPRLQPGSSIMPGKVNPVVPEMVIQAGYQVLGNDQVIAQAAAAGMLDLNAFMPLIAHNLLQSLELLNRAADSFTEKCIRGITANAANCRRHLEQSHAFITALVPHLGYGSCAELVKRAIETGRPIREVVLQSGLIGVEDLEAILSPGQLTSPGVAGASLLKKK